MHLARGCSRWGWRRASSTAVTKSWADPTAEELVAEVAKIFAEKEKDNPIVCSLGLLGASMLGHPELYQEGMRLMCKDLGAEPLAHLDHNTASEDDIRACIHDLTKTFPMHPGPFDMRAWMLGRVIMSAEYMCDRGRAVTGASVLYALLDKQQMTAPEIWACGYLLHFRGSTVANSFSQIRNTVSGVHQPRDAFGLEAKRTEGLVKQMPPSALGDAIWGRVMYIHGIARAGAEEDWPRHTWCHRALTHLPVGDYKAWAHAMVAHAAANCRQKEESQRHAYEAIKICRQHPPEQRAPHEDMLTTLTLRSAFVDLHPLDPKLSKKVAKHCTPKLPFVVRGHPPTLLGVPRYGYFKLKNTTATILPVQLPNSIFNSSGISGGLAISENQ
eukprot:TRINITY_DN5523_c0_g1_i2.p1 TRINITY_DN5523_c0_g1~~TRINITY_DN5523_c0_g1_i2.p1  ORF type:complete len:386 (+),score=97.31 TRINITY_DN5523_c0_g1_i2:52-1209(+)